MIKLSTLEKAYVAKSSHSEDRAVFEFINKLPNQKYKWLDAAAGLGRFPIRLSKEDKRFDITCLDINPKLVERLKKEDFQEVVEGSITKIPFPENNFDIVHASHIIEHFGFPDIADVLDELVRVIKVGGYLIIRSPLMHPGFWNDIDHIRPYPPKCILQYSDHVQQQREGRGKIKIVHSWLRQEAIAISSPNIPSFMAWPINWLLKKLWIMVSYPRSRANGYVAIFQKI